MGNILHYFLKLIDTDVFMMTRFGLMRTLKLYIVVVKIIYISIFGIDSKET
jgi:hypothetical protein